MTIRKNFIFDDKTAKHLEEIAKIEGKTQTTVTKEAIETKYKEIKQKKRLQAFEAFVGSAPKGTLTTLNVKEMQKKRALNG